LTNGINAQKLSLDSAINNITQQLILFPQEKIYMHVDKPYYITGERIFFRAYLLDALDNKPVNVSRYVYAELINPLDSVICRVKLLAKENIFSGSIPIPETLPFGNYIIRAYTQYMNNQGPDYFYSYNIHITDPANASVKTDTEFRFNGKNTVNVRLKITDSETEAVIIPEKIDLRLNKEKINSYTPDKDGWINVKYNLAENEPKRILYVEFPKEKRIIRQFFRIPNPENIFDVSFYPEGGHLVPGQLSKIAFKAVKTNGNPLDVTGKVLNKKEDLIAEFNTVHDGMGYFAFIPEEEEDYYAICYHNNDSIRFELPKANKDASTLQTRWGKEQLLISVVRSPLAVQDSPLYAIIHSGGLVFHAQEVDPDKNMFSINKSLFPSGISHLLLLSEDMRVISERLVFFLKEDWGKTLVQTAQATYKKREQVVAEIQLKDNENQPLPAGFSISVTDDKDVTVDSHSNILSYSLLTSELKGHINHPTYYFQTENKNTVVAADLLMMTHGWNRYDIPKVVLGEFRHPEIPVETGTQISGIVKGGILNKPEKNQPVNMYISKENLFINTQTNENGQFVFDMEDLEIPDSTNIVINAIKPKEKNRLELNIDPERFPKNNPFLDYPDNEDVFIPFEYISKADLKYTYENGVRVVDLDEVEVTAKKLSERTSNIYYSSADATMNEKQIDRFPATDMKSLLSTFSGVAISGDKIRIRGAGGAPLIMIDGEIMQTFGDDQATISLLNQLYVRDIAQIDIIKNAGNLAVFGMQGGNGVISIFRKDNTNATNIAVDQPQIKTIKPLGVQTPVEFFSPKYETRAEIDSPTPDVRTTIYWKPDAVTDSEGKITLKFYTADNPSTYTLIIQGMSNDGKLIHYEENAAINVEN
jgi:hypothetical protein